MVLANTQVVALVEAGALIGTYWTECSEFELETLADVALRFCRGRREAVVTAAEWNFCAEAIEAMRNGRRRDEQARARAAFLAGTRAA